MANSSVKTMVSVPPSAQVKRLGDYPLIAALGAGGMANIYKSKQISLRRTVALKVLKPAVATEEQFAMRFEMEAQTLAELQHENIVQIYDHRQDDGLQYMVMEYVEGFDLFDLMERCGPLPPEVTAIIALHVARALEPFRILFLEDPTTPDGTDALREVCSGSPVPIGAGERHHTLYEFRELLQAGVKTLKPDVGLAGGLTHCRKISALAEAWQAHVGLQRFHACL